MRATQTVVALLAASAVTFAGVRIADACGCVSPPIPDKAPDYAVNQRAEQIIFEVEQNWVTAHVLIKYAGEPSAFAWIIPVPEAPELAISPSSAFGVLDQLTEPIIDAQPDNICPVSEWQCRYHPTISCGEGDDDGLPGFQDAGVSDAPSGGGNPPPVDIIDEQVVGDYQTVTFRASESALATQWLRDNGFIVNQTTALYMEPYVEANMVFVAAKLVPGAGVDAIKPLRLRYRAPFPMVPLVLTAVAAEPHLTVTTFIYGQTPFRPMGHPVVTIDPARIAQDDTGRVNYPMVLARTIDEAGGDAFAIEYLGSSPRPDYNGTAFCCETGGFDVCGVGNNDRCECPRDDFDAEDCEARGDLIEGVALVDSLQARYPIMTRITTRISPEEMRFDPTFEPGSAGPGSPAGRLRLDGRSVSLDGCWGQVMDADTFVDIQAREDCTAIYCGAGQCVTAGDSAGCACDAGFVAHQFVDLDGQKSVTCIPAVPTVDLGAGGLELPDACQGVSCGMGQCRDRNGQAVCECNGGAAAVRDPNGSMPRCEPIGLLTATPGAEDYSQPMRELQVCAPPPPACADDGWHEQVVSPRVGVDCGDATPSAAQREPPPAPVCGGLTGGFGAMYGCGCSGAHPASALMLVWVVAFLLLRRRPRARR